MNGWKGVTCAIGALVAMIALSLAMPSLALAQEAEGQKADQTGTNPINFARDIRAYNEYTWFNVPSGFDGNQNVTTVEFRTPFADGKWQWRARARFSSFDLENNGPGGLDNLIWL